MTKICMEITIHLKRLNRHVLMTLTALQFKMWVAMVLEFFIFVKGALRVLAPRVSIQRKMSISLVSAAIFCYFPIKPASFSIIFELHSLDLERFTCFDVVLKNGGRDAYTWELGPCVPSHAFDYDFSEYTEKCCVPNGNYLLSCIVKDQSSSGWLTNTFVRIGRHKFCDDFPGYNALRAIHVLGMNLHLVINFCPLFFSSKFVHKNYC